MSECEGGCGRVPEVYGSSFCSGCHDRVPELAKRRILDLRNALIDIGYGRGRSITKIRRVAKDALGYNTGEGL
jgi:hypothetical protein